MKFSVLLRKYSEHKRRKGLSGKVTLKEARILKKNALRMIAESKKRPALKVPGKAQLVEAMKKSPLFKSLAEGLIKYKAKTYRKKVTLKEMQILYAKVAGSRKLLSEFSAYKVKKYGKKPTLNEMKNLIEKSQAPAKKLTESKPSKAGFKKYVEAFKEYKKAKRGVSKITEAELVSLKKKYLAKFAESSKPKVGTFEKLIENYKKYKKAKGLSESVSYKEMKTLKDAFKKNPKIREAGEGFADPAAAGGAPADPMAGGDPNAMGADPMAAGGATPEITAAVQGIKDQVEALAQQVGIQDVNDNLGADAAAGIPPVDGAGGAPGADGGAPVMESKKKRPTDRISALRERINKRAKALREEGDLGGLTDAAHDQAAVGIPDLGGPASDDGDNAASNESLLEVPAASKIASGVDGDNGAESGETWPTKDDVPGEGKALQGDGAKTIGESVDDVTRRYVNKALSKKLSFGDLKAALKEGRLG